MYIKRDYSQPFFGDRRRRRSSGRFILIFVMILAIFLLLVYTQFDRLQLMALDAVGMAPTATPFASTLATEGYNRMLAGKLDEAAVLFAQAVSQQPDNIDYIYEYGRLLIDLGSYEEALALAENALQINGQDVRGYALKTKALVWGDRADEAIPVGVAGLEIDPNFAPLYASLARAYTSIGRYQQGLDYGQRAVELDPMDIDSHRSYAYTLIWVGDRNQAIDQLEQAVALNPNLTDPYFELAINYLAQNEDVLAIATYERVLSLDPRNARAYLRLCEAYFKVGQNAQAQGYCEDALDLNPNYAQAYRQLGMVNYNRRNYESAIENFERCVASSSDEIECWYLRGLAHYYLGQCDDAWRVLQESLPMGEQLAGGENIVNAIREGLRLVTVSCAGYAGQALPTAIPPTPIPPTPIGSF